MIVAELFQAKKQWIRLSNLEGYDTRLTVTVHSTFIDQVEDVIIKDDHIATLSLSKGEAAVIEYTRPMGCLGKIELHVSACAEFDEQFIKVSTSKHPFVVK